jgi:hypothetical protein
MTVLDGVECLGNSSLMTSIGNLLRACSAQ